MLCLAAWVRSPEPWVEEDGNASESSFDLIHAPHTRTWHNRSVAYTEAEIITHNKRLVIGLTKNVING